MSGQYALHYLAGTPLLTDQIAEWIMARTPSRYAVAVLEHLGPWAKPSAVTGALALLGACLFAARSMATPRIGSCVWSALRGRHGIRGSAIAPSPGFALFGFLRFVSPYSPVSADRNSNLFSLQRRALLMTARRDRGGGRKLSSRRNSRAPRPSTVDLFPFQPPLDRANFAPGLVRKAVTPLPEFYGMSKDTVDPTIDPQSWRLLSRSTASRSVNSAMVNFSDCRRQIRYVTLRCISNTLKSDLMGTAIWAGVHLSQLIDRAALPSNVIEAAFIGVEGHDDSLRLDYAFQ